jgi:hypothetical protein
MTGDEMTETPKVLMLTVTRNLDNRFEGLSDVSPRAVELHERRKIALHDALDGDPAIQVTDWGLTDDVQPHEHVDLILTVLATGVFSHAVVPGAKWLAEKLAEKAFDFALSKAIERVVALFRPKQEARDLNDFIVKLPDGTSIAVIPPQSGATIKIWFSDGKFESLEYTKVSE